MYYYLDGIEKKGPYSFDEIKVRDLPEDTLIFSDFIGKWKPIKDIQEFNENSQNDVQPDNVVASGSIEIKDTKNTDIPLLKSGSTKLEKNKINISAFLLLPLFYLVIIGSSYYVLIYQKHNDLVLMNKKIDAVFKDKEAISDYSFTQPQGTLYKVYITPKDDIFGGWVNYDKYETENGERKKIAHLLAFPPSEFDKKYEKDSKRQKYELYSSLVEYYESDSLNGFTVHKLERSSPSRFILRMMWSSNMGYKVPESTYYEGINYGYGLSRPGYHSSTYRPSIKQCYEGAAKYLMGDKEENTYQAGSYNKIVNFSDIETKFYKISEDYEHYYRIFNRKYLKRGKDEPTLTYYIGGFPYVYSSDWVVWYDDLHNNYYLDDNKEAFRNYLIVYSFVGILMVTITFIILRYRKRIVFQ